MINPERLIAAHIPVIHRGYIELFSSSPDASIGVLDQEIVNQFDYLRKDIRALEPQESVELIRGIGRQAHLLSEQQLVEVAQQTELIMPADDISRQLIARHALQNVTLHPVFLRWDRTNTAANVEVIPDKTIEAADVNPSILQKLEQEAGESTNWWRHVSALIEKDGDIVASARNQTLPTDHTLYLDGDPRITAQRGQNIETSLDIHAESKLIAEIARTGTSLEGASLYVSTFPCPNCAKLIATSGIKECYFVEGYAMLDGHSVLKQADVSVIKINGSIDGDQSTLVLPYRKSN